MAEEGAGGVGGAEAEVGEVVVAHAWAEAGGHGRRWAGLLRSVARLLHRAQREELRGLRSVPGPVPRLRELLPV
jgi:hypothetical protein